MDKNCLIPAIITSGECKYKVGKATLPNKYGNVMFYPKEGMYPKYLCKRFNEIEYYEKEEVNN
jgi:hypothetical protein